MAATPQLLPWSAQSQNDEDRQDEQKAKSCDIDMCRQNFPEELSPFEQHIGDVEHLQDPHPVVVAEVEIRHDSSSLRVANVATVEVGEDVEKTHNGQHLLVELHVSINQCSLPISFIQTFLRIRR